jgi:hypothetical protein
MHFGGVVAPKPTFSSIGERVPPHRHALNVGLDPPGWLLLLPMMPWLLRMQLRLEHGKHHRLGSFLGGTFFRLIPKMRSLFMVVR